MLKINFEVETIFGKSAVSKTALSRLSNILVPVTVNLNIKVPARFETTTQEPYQYSYIYLNKSDIPNDSFLCIYRIEKSHSVTKSIQI